MRYGSSAIICIHISSINWVDTNLDILWDAADFYIDLLIRKLSGERVALVRGLEEYVNSRSNEITSPDGVPNKISTSTICGLLHLTGSFMRIGLDLRYAVTWRDKPLLQAIKELNALKKNHRDN